MSDFSICLVACSVVALAWIFRNKKEIRVKGPGFELHAKDGERNPKEAKK